MKDSQSRFFRVRVGDLVGRVAPTWADLPGKLFTSQDGTKETVKEDATTTVWKRTLDLTGGRLTMYVKHYHHRKSLGPLWDLFRGSRARRGRRVGNRLLDLGLGAAKPLVMLERRRLGVFPTESWLVTEAVEGAERLGRVAASVGGHRERKVLAEVLAGWVRRLHAGGVSARDLKPNNLLVYHRGGSYEVALVDFDGVRVGRRVGESRRVRDLARLARGLSGRKVSNADRMRFLVNYLGGGSSRAECHRWWGRIEAKVREKLESKRSG